VTNLILPEGEPTKRKSLIRKIIIELVLRPGRMFWAEKVASFFKYL